MNASNRTHEIDGIGEIRVLYGNSDLIEFLDADREAIVVDDATEWMAEQRPEPDGGTTPFDGRCPMCGEQYDSYTYHLRDCSP